MKGGWKAESGSESKPYDVRVDPWLKKLDNKEQLQLEDLLEDRFLVGSVDTWVETLDRWIEQIQPEEIVLRLRFQGGPSPEATIKAIERIGRDIIPRYA